MVLETEQRLLTHLFLLFSYEKFEFHTIGKLQPCPAAPLVEHGDVSHCNYMYHGDTCKVKCHDGYQPFQTDTYTCTAGSHWGYPRCVEITKESNILTDSDDFIALANNKSIDWTEVVVYTGVETAVERPLIARRLQEAPADQTDEEWLSTFVNLPETFRAYEEALKQIVGFDLALDELNDKVKPMPDGSVLTKKKSQLQILLFYFEKLFKFDFF